MIDHASIPRGIDSLRRGGQAREPIACALTMGRKGPSNAPIDKHRFFIVRPVADGAGRDARRSPHPSFADFNRTKEQLPASASDAQRAEHDEKRATVRGILVHADPTDCWTNRRQADRLPGLTHPRLAPVCMGNGSSAMRWDNQVGDYYAMDCPGDKCPHAQSAGGQRPACHPHTKLIFQLRFENAPCLLCKFTSNGWETASAIDGFFADVQRQASMLGVDSPSFYGIPFVLTISSKSNPQAKTKWVVVHMSTDFPPGLTLQEYLLRQADARRQLVSAVPLLQIGTAANLDDDSDAIADDARALMPGSVPAVDAK